MQLNQEDDSNRKFILVEVGDYFDTVLKPRIQKVAYAADWKEGRPVPGSPGQSHMFHYIRLESYEDSLDNLRFRELGRDAQAALYALPDYFLRYMLDFETRGSPSLLDTERFDKPFQYQLRHHAPAGDGAADGRFGDNFQLPARPARTHPAPLRA